MATNKQILGEIIPKRTANAKHYLLLDGTKQAMIYGGDIHFTDEYGNWQNIDTTLFDETDFDKIEFPVYTEKAKEFHSLKSQAAAQKTNQSADRQRGYYHGLRVPHNTKIAKQWRKGYQIGKGSDSLKFVPVGASPAFGYVEPSDNSKIEYQDAWNDTDVCLELLSTGVKETITLKSASAPTTFTFQVIGALAADLTCGAFAIQPAWLQDANGTKKDVTQTIRTGTDGNTYLDLVADTTGLAFPVVIDPTVTLQPASSSTNFEAMVLSYNPTTAYPNQSGVSVGTNYSNPNYMIYRDYLQLDISSIPANSDIVSATLNYYVTSDVNAPITVEAHQVTGSWSPSMTWNSQPTYNATAASSVTFSSTISNQWNSWNLTSLVQSWVNGTANYGTVLKASVEGSPNNNYINADGLGATAAYRPYYTINYDVPPGAPGAITAPAAGATVNSTATITWGAATAGSVAQSSLTYQIDLSTNNGSTWTNIVSATAAGATSYTYDFTNQPATSTALLRVRAYDGTAYGPYKTQSSVFTIQHNVAPNAPTGLSPTGNTAFDLTQPITLSWTYSNQNAGDTQSKFDLQWSSNGGSTWNTVTQSTSAQSYTAPANTFPHGSIVWQVRTYDQSGLAGPYSSQATFFAGNVPATPVISSPANNSTVAVAQPTVQWSSVGQTDYQLQALQGASVVYDSGDAISTNKAATIGANLSNNTAYTLQVRIKNADGLWSAWATTAVTVSFTPPATTTITATPSNTNANIVIAVTNPAPSGTQPTVSGNDLYRRVTGTTNWTRIATNIANNGTYTDYAVASGTSYDYYVQVNGSNGTYGTSATVTTAGVKLIGLWIHAVNNPAGTIQNVKYQQEFKKSEWVPDSAVMQFAGRTRPVVEFGQQESYTLTAQKLTLLTSDNSWPTLEALLRSKTTLCVRDGRGRKVFCAVNDIQNQDDMYGNLVDVPFIEVAYTEAV